MGYRLLLLTLLAAAAGYLVVAARIPMDPFTAAETVNARTLPLLYGGLLAVTLLVLLARRRPPAGRAAGAEPPPTPRLGRGAGLCVLLLGFALSIERINLWLGLGALLLTSALLLGERRWVALGLVATLVPLGGYLLVEQLLGVRLPG